MTVHDVRRRVSRAKQKRVRVLFVPQWYPPKENHNQVSGTFCREHVRAAALYDDVAVLSFGFGADTGFAIQWEQVNDCGVPTFYATYGRSPIPKTTFLAFKVQLARALSHVIQQWGAPDVIHSQDLHAYDVVKAARLLRLRTPCVISQHSGELLRGQVDHRTARRFRWVFARAARVLAANRYAAADYRRYGLNASFGWLPNALDTETFFPILDRPREPWLLHASGFTEPKRFPDILRAFALVRRERPGVLLQVAGGGPKRAEMEALAQRELPAASFRFHGFLDKSKLADLMRRSSGFIFPSSAETFGCVLMEAMACGCPVLTTRVGGIPAVVRDGEGIFVEVGNIDQIAAGMIQLLDGTHGLDMGRVSGQALDRFSHEAIGRILHNEYLTAAGLADAMVDSKDQSLALELIDR